MAALLVLIADSNGRMLRSNLVVTSITVLQMRGITDLSPFDDFVDRTTNSRWEAPGVAVARENAVGGTKRRGMLLVEQGPPR